MSQSEITLTSEITVRLIQSMGGDHVVAAAARVSTCGEDALKLASPDQAAANAGLIRYLMQHRHGTPFEHASMTFFVHAPIFVWREWHRHRIGFCLSGDTEIWNETISRNHGRTVRKRPIAELWRNWHEGVPDSLGRVRLLQSCRGLPLRNLNEDDGTFGLARMTDIFKSGIKELLGVKTVDGRSLKCSADHRILTDQGWARAGDLEQGTLIARVGKASAFTGRQIPPSLRAGIGVWTSMQRVTLIKPTDRCYVCGAAFDREGLILDHVIPVVEDLTRALDTTNLKPICSVCHRRKTDAEQKQAQRCNVAAVKWAKVAEAPRVVTEEMTYDITVEGPWHNFVANSLVVHNSYNEESARYRTLDPVFYVPPRDRPMLKVEGWKPGRPRFSPCEDELVYRKLRDNLRESYVLAYQAYQDNLALGIDPGLARACLPVGIYSSCWVTCNPRSLMAFLSLRTYEPDAKFVSYPLHEIEVAARAAESILDAGWPITGRAFRAGGRVAP